MEFEICPLGDRAILLRFGNGASVANNRWVHLARSAMGAAGIRGLLACSPAYNSLSLQLDLAWLARHGGSASLLSQLRDLLSTLDVDLEPPTSRLVEIPTVYGADHGPDLGEVAELSGLSVAQVVEAHAEPVYLVAMVGFQPGFPYLLGLAASLHLPRRNSVRTRVPAGSVAIAGAQTGIYPSESPGGWHLIGRTELALFDCHRSPASWLAPGDRVRFVPG